MEYWVREIRDHFITRTWSRQLYDGLYFSPEREFAEGSIPTSQRHATGQFRMIAYKGSVSFPLRLITDKTLLLTLVFLIRCVHTWPLKLSQQSLRQARGLDGLNGRLQRLRHQWIYRNQRSQAPEVWLADEKGQAAPDSNMELEG